MTLIKRMLPAAMLTFALMGLHAGSQAGTVTTQHGAGCKASGWSYASVGIAFGHAGGFVNMGNDEHEPIGVVCPVTRVGSTPGGLWVWIDGYAPTGSAVSCMLWSFDYKGLPLASQSFELISTGAPFDLSLQLTSASVPAYSSQVVTCQLPEGGAIFDIEPISR